MEREIKKQDLGKEISLQVPANVNLVEMSNQELEEVALKMARQAAAGVDKGATLLGIDKMVLTNNPAADVGVWGQWERSCGKVDLNREGLVINPEVFTRPTLPSAQVKSAKTVIQNKAKK